MNYLYCGLPSDLNIGNGKTLSAVRAMMIEYQESMGKKTIFSNIKLLGIEYQEFSPHNIMDVLDTPDSIVLFDEISAIVHKNHRMSPTCQAHGKENIGLCYMMTQFVRQVRKKRISAYFTAQVHSDVQKQLRDMIQVTVICEKYGLQNGQLKKCMKDNCSENHEHYIRQIDTRTFEEKYIPAKPVYGKYDSSELVRGWQ